MAKNCKDCNKDISRDFVRRDTKLDMCDDCVEESMGLIKVDNHYVPWGYRNHADTLEPTGPDYYDDVYAKMPKVEWCDKYKKYKLTFHGTDFGGYEADEFEWYFDTKEEIFELIFGEELNYDV